MRVFKKISTPFTKSNPDKAIIVVNAIDPQINTVKSFMQACDETGISFTVFVSKIDKVKDTSIVGEIKSKLGLKDIQYGSIKTGKGMKKLKTYLNLWKGKRIILLGSFNCLSGDTKIICKKTQQQHGYKEFTLRELAIKQSRKSIPSRNIKVLSYNPENSEIVLSDAKIFSSGAQNVYRIILEDGRFVEGTQNHRLFTYDNNNQLQEVRIKELKTGDYIICEDENNISAWTEWCNDKQFTKGARIQQRRRRRQRNIDNNPMNKLESRLKCSESLKSNKEYIERARQHCREIQVLSPKGMDRKGKTYEESYGEERAKDIKKKLSEALSGENNPQYGKITYPKGKFDTELGHYIRSSWERNICLLLRENNIEYEYEPHAYKLNIEGRNATYTPDIKLSNGTFIEVKGPLFDWQVKKMKEFVRTGHKLLLIMNKRKQYINQIKDWCTDYAFYGEDDNILQMIKNHCIHSVRIEKIEIIGKTDTYDISVPKFHNFFLSNGILSHNSGKSSIINKLCNTEYEVGDIPGTTLQFTETTLDDGTVVIDSVGQLIDIHKPMMVSIDFSGCSTREEKMDKVFTEAIRGLIQTQESTKNDLSIVIDILKKCIESGNKIITCGAGASAIVSRTIAGQGTECGFPIMVFTNDGAEIQPISFSKGIGEQEGAISKYIANVINKNDCIIATSCSGGTGFVYDVLKRAKDKEAITIAITENIDTPLCKYADYILKSDIKPEGPSASKSIIAHMTIGHVLMLVLADEIGVTADEAIGYMLPEYVPSKLLGIK